MQLNMDGDFEILTFKEYQSVLFYDNTNYESYPLHWHNSIEVIMPVEKPYTVTCADKTYVVKENELFIVPAKSLHSYKAQRGRRFFLIVDNKTIEENSALNALNLLLSSPIHIKSKDNLLLQELCRLMWEIKADYFNSNPTTEISIYIKTLTLLNSILKNVLSINEDYPSSDDSDVLKFALRYIEKNFSSDISLDTLADLSGYNKFYFSKLFSKYMGKSIPEYINKRRISASEALLLDKSLKISDIALLVGFSSISSFNRSFKNETGISPSEFKKLHYRKMHKLSP